MRVHQRAFLPQAVGCRAAHAAAYRGSIHPQLALSLSRRVVVHSLTRLVGGPQARVPLYVPHADF